MNPGVHSQLRGQPREHGVDWITGDQVRTEAESTAGVSLKESVWLPIR